MPTRSVRWLVRSLILGWFLMAPGVASAQDRYFMVVFGAQNQPNSPQRSHTFATFIKASSNGAAPGTCILETHTISWLPQTLKVRFFALLPECGRNFGLHETMRWAQSTGDEVAVWGPFEIEQDLYDRALVQISVLESGQVKYKCVDSGYNSAKVSNCIHAVTTLGSGYRTRIVSPAWGEAASYYTVLRLYPKIINPGCTYRQLLAPMSLDHYPLHYMDLDQRPPGVYGVLVELFEARRAKTP